MELIWMPNAQEDYLDTLAYCQNRSQLFNYPPTLEQYPILRHRNRSPIPPL